MGKELAITNDQVDKLVGIGVTGHDMGTGNMYPSVINILQSDKQYDAFGDGDNITKKMYGKLFVRTDSNTTKNLVDSVEGTIVKIERGYEIRNEDNKIEESGYGFLKATEKDEFVEKGFKPINMVKVLLALGSFKEVDKKMTVLKKKIEDGVLVEKEDYPFAVAVVKGSSFGNWFTVEKAMQDLANEYFKRPLNQLPIIAFKLKVTSKKEEGTDFTYYSMDFEVLANDADEALRFEPYLLEAKDQNLFYKVKERVYSEEQLDAMDDTKEAVKDGEVVEDMDEEDIDELPF